MVVIIGTWWSYDEVSGSRGSSDNKGGELVVVTGVQVTVVGGVVVTVIMR